jgi:drug/metabolite transporter (DMT)-like permease
MAIAFVGTAVIILRGGGLSAVDFSLTGAIIILISSVLLGYRLILASQQAKQIDTIRVVTWQMLLPLWAFALGGFLLEDIAWSNMGWLPVSGILYQGVVIAGLGFMVNTWMLKTYSPSIVVSFGFLAPISGVMLSIWLLGETFTWVVAIGTVCVGAGLLLITKEPRKKA